MAAPDITFRRRPDAAAKRRERAAVDMPGISCLLVWTTLAAVVVGLAAGALACSAALAAGSGHLVHAQPSTAPVEPATRSHVGHGTVHFVGEGAEPLVGSGAIGYDTRSESAGTGGQDHPGMACVVTFELDTAELVTTMVTVRFDDPRAGSPAECARDVDPPVPRSS